MRKRLAHTTATALIVAMLLAACTGSTTDTPAPSEGPVSGASTTALAIDAEQVGLSATGFAATTPPGAEEVDVVTWALYRDVAGLDPIYAFDYPENTSLALMCEAPLRQAPDGTIVPGLAAVELTDGTTYVLTIDERASFWNGDPVTADDVAFSLERNRDPDLGSFYGAAFDRVATIEATDERTVTITMTEPDLWFHSVLASTAAFVVQRSFVEAAGADFGNPTGRTMCSGSYELGDWAVGSPLTVNRRDAYWQSDIKPLVASIEFVGAPDPIALSAAIQAGDVNGYYAFASIPTLAELEQDPNVTVTAGAGYQYDAMLIAPRPGSPLEDVRVRQALSLAIDRQGYIDTVLAGAATLPRSVIPPGTWGYATGEFHDAWNALPEPAMDVERARQLIAEAGVEGQSFTIGLIGEVPPMVAEGAVFQKAAQDIGLQAEVTAFPADQYISLFIDPAARAEVDAWFTVAYADAADPGPALAQIAVPGGTVNYGYENAEVTRLLDDARSTSDEDERARLTVEAQAIVAEELPLIPVAHPHNLLITSSDLTGAVASFSMMFAPWANDLGGT